MHIKPDIKNSLTNEDNLNTNFTLIEAEKFFKELWEDLFVSGDVDRLSDFYLENIIVHYGNETIGFNDLKKRILILKNKTKNYCKVRDVTLIDKSLFFLVCEQSWINKNDESFHELLVFVIYRILNKKVCEMWLSLEYPTVKYKTINTDFTQYMQRFELNQKSKHNFMSRMDIVLDINTNESIKLSKTEKECLYYYFNGFSAKETALEMSLSARTIETYLAIIKEKFMCHDKRSLRKKIFPTHKN